MTARAPSAAASGEWRSSLQLAAWRFLFFGLMVLQWADLNHSPVPKEYHTMFAADHFEWLVTYGLVPKTAEEGRLTRDTGLALGTMVSPMAPISATHDAKPRDDNGIRHNPPESRARSNVAITCV